MWNKDDLRQASYRQIPFDFIDVDDGFKKAAAKYDYPYADGSDLEDMGLEARTVKIKAVFLPESYNLLDAFIAALKEQGAGEGVHPRFGTFQAMPDTVSIRHDERAYFAEVDITFIEHLSLAVSAPAISAAGKAALAASEVNDTFFDADSALDLALKDSGIPTDIPTTGLGADGFMAALAGYSSRVRQAMAAINSIVGIVNGYVNQAIAPFKLITSTVAFAADLPARILGTFAGAIESVAGAYASLLNAPGKFTSSLNFGLLKIESSLGDFNGDKAMKAGWHVSKATAICSAASLELSIDEAAEAGESVSLNSYGMDSEASRLQLMTINEIDAVAAVAREAIVIAISAARDAFEDSYELEASLKRLALIIQETADDVRLRREKIVDYEVPSDMPLHLLAFNLYGGINEAERLLRINNIKNPNFLKAGEALKIYA
ncbi:MAG: DNA circularization N-terminal domain-containing protein [Deltaproteobacteria bacterium]|nr:DNA circularization N-terminal domain-containing protein [Deltaproteobacteria bacterium]